MLLITNGPIRTTKCLLPERRGKIDRTPIMRMLQRVDSHLRLPHQPPSLDAGYRIAYTASNWAANTKAQVRRRELQQGRYTYVLRMTSHRSANS